MRIEPTLDRVVVKPASMKEMSDGGIYIPDAAQERPNSGRVVAIGPGRPETGPLPIEVGQLVLYSQWNGVKVEIDRTEYVILRYEDVYGILEEKDE